MAKTIAEIESELGGLTDNVESLVLTLSEIENFLSKKEQNDQTYCIDDQYS